MHLLPPQGRNSYHVEKQARISIFHSRVHSVVVEPAQLDDKSEGSRFSDGPSEVFTSGGPFLLLKAIFSSNTDSIRSLSRFLLSVTWRAVSAEIFRTGIGQQLPQCFIPLCAVFSRAGTGAYAHVR